MRHRGGGVGHRGTHFANRCLLSQEHAVVSLDNEDSGTGEGDREDGEDVDMSDGHEDNRVEGNAQVTGEEGQGKDNEGEDSSCETDEDGHKDEDDEDLRDDDEAIVDSAGFGSL